MSTTPREQPEWSPCTIHYLTASHLEFLALFDRHSCLENTVQDDIAGQVLERHGAWRAALGTQHVRRLLLGIQVLKINFTTSV